MLQVKQEAEIIERLKASKGAVTGLIAEVQSTIKQAPQKKRKLQQKGLYIDGSEQVSTFNEAIQQMTNSIESRFKLVKCGGNLYVGYDTDFLFNGMYVVVSTDIFNFESMALQAELYDYMRSRVCYAIPRWWWYGFALADFCTFMERAFSFVREERTEGNEAMEKDAVVLNNLFTVLRAFTDNSNFITAVKNIV